MNAQQIDNILSQAKIDKNGRIMNKMRLNDMIFALHLRSVKNEEVLAEKENCFHSEQHKTMNMLHGWWFCPMCGIEIKQFDD